MPQPPNQPAQPGQPGQPQNPQNKIQLRITDDIAKGTYSNLMEIKARREEFCLDFLNIFPPVGAVTARIIISPGHLKRMVRALQESLKKHEAQFGTIEEASEPEKPFGFTAN